MIIRESFDLKQIIYAKIDAIAEYREAQELYDLIEELITSRWIDGIQYELSRPEHDTCGLENIEE